MIAGGLGGCLQSEKGLFTHKFKHCVLVPASTVHDAQNSLLSDYCSQDKLNILGKRACRELNENRYHSDLYSEHGAASSIRLA